ncbi:MAG TPA: helical backbone metal receptor [Bdellovibrionales bacterium]|nr:helical backbone metal receptor [Bdellovibrionales bacterium]
MPRALALSLLVLTSTASGAADPRLVTLNPAVTEIVFALGHGNKIVGTVNESDEPSEAKALTRVGSYGRPNLEKIIQLKPTAVITFREGIDQVSGTLKRAGIKLLVIEGKTLSDFSKIVTTVGEELAAQDRARTLIEAWDKEWAALEKHPQNPSLVLQLERTPLIIAGGGTFLSEIVSRCGFKNAFAHLNGYPTLSREAIYKKRIDLLVVLMEKLSDSDKEGIRKSWKASPLSKDTPVLFYDPHRLSRLAPALPGEAKRLCKALREKT